MHSLAVDACFNQLLKSDRRVHKQRLPHQINVISLHKYKHVETCVARVSCDRFFLVDLFDFGGDVFARRVHVEDRRVRVEAHRVQLVALLRHNFAEFSEVFLNERVSKRIDVFGWQISVELQLQQFGSLD